MQATEDQTYEGWQNYETWGAALVLNNDQHTQSQALEALEEIKQAAPDDQNVPEIWTVEQCVRYRFADWLKDYIEELCYPEDIEAPSQMAQQMIGGALSNVDYHEIAASLIEE